MSALVPLETSQVEHLDPAMREVAVSTYLEHAKNWLSTAVDSTGPEQIAAAKAEIATAAEATKQLNLSKEIRLDAQEMVRRAEYALGKSIRKGQAEGTVNSHGSGGDRRSATFKVEGSATSKASPYEFAKHTDLYGDGKQGGNGIYALADNATTQEEFDAALDEAKSEENLSRSNVVRKTKGNAPSQPGVPKSASGDSGKKRPSRAEKAEILRDLAAQGYSSRQMLKPLGYSRDDMVRELAREYGIEIHADKVMGKTRRLNADRIAAETIAALQGIADGVQLIDYDDLDPEEARHWAASLEECWPALVKFRSQIKARRQPNE